MDTTEAPQVIEHVSSALALTPFDTKWIPCSARFIMLGQTPRAKGAFHVYQLNQGKLELLHDWEKSDGIKSATFRASPVSIRDVATVDYKGKLVIFDIEKGTEKYSV